jgi:hypothetical protein
MAALLLLTWGCDASEDPEFAPKAPADSDEVPDLIEDTEVPPADTDVPDTPDDPPTPWVAPEFPHFDQVVDLARGSTPAWGYVTYIDTHEGEPVYASYDYDGTAHALDFWPASTIKIYTVTAALVLLEQEGLSLDTEATFYRRASSSDPWTEDITVSFREMIYDTFDHSSNPDYTLLLRFAGIDWLSESFFTPEHGFSETALLVGYTNDRPWRYTREEAQRIVLRDGDVEVERTHTWSGTPYDDLVGCGYRYSTRANCSSPSDMAEHMRRLMMHEHLDLADRFVVDDEALDWVRYGDGQLDVMLAPGDDWAEGVLRVLPEARYHHKAGQVSNFALDLHHVDDPGSNTRFVASLVTQSAGRAAYKKISEEVTRMLATPESYIHLDWLQDYVNPVTADLWIYTAVPGTLELVVKDGSLDGMSPTGWEVLEGTSVQLTPGTHDVALASDCLSRDGRHHVRGRFTSDDGQVQTTSDLHYVIIDADMPCP